MADRALYKYRSDDSEAGAKPPDKNVNEFFTDL